MNSTYDVFGQKRIYHIALPSKSLYGDDLPVIMHFHGGFGNGANSAKEEGIVTKAAPLGFLVIMAEGYQMQNGGRKWSAGSCCGSCASNATCGCYIDDVRYVSGIIDNLIREKFITTRSPVFASGHSNGGMLTY